MRKCIVILLMMFMVLGLTGCGEKEMSYKQIGMEEAVSMMETETDYIILDVRTPEEFAEKHIPNAINVPNEVIGTEEIVEKGKPNKLIRWREITEDMPTYWQLPYRSMLPRDIPNLLICGRAIDTDKGALAAARVMISLNQTGEAAGVACAVAAASGENLHNIDIKKVQSILRENGAAVFEEDVTSQQGEKYV